METTRLISGLCQELGQACSRMRSYCMIRSNKLHRKNCQRDNERKQQFRDQQISFFVSKSEAVAKTERKDGCVERGFVAQCCNLALSQANKSAADLCQQDHPLNKPNASPTSSEAAKTSKSPSFSHSDRINSRRSIEADGDCDHPCHYKLVNISKKSAQTSSLGASPLLVVVLIFALSLVEWKAQNMQQRYVREAQEDRESENIDYLFSIKQSIARHFDRTPARNGFMLANAQQYKPEWPHKTLEQEIFLLNLEDGYFGCQVNSSQDFLQLFELSRLCDGQAQCYLGTDELVGPLKCRNRERCDTYNSTGSNGQQEAVQCINGVCLDGLCYCNDGFGGKSCDIPDENECKFRPCDVFAHCTNTMGSYYCSCFPGYDGDGMHCQDINECEIPSLRALCSDNSECVNLPGHFVCKCKPGYQQSGQSQSSLTGAPIGNATVQCTDIDECLDERACGKLAICENLPGSFKCSCPHGFTGDPSVECFDMDECRNNPCGVGAQCTNMPGGYRCSCEPGHERNPAAPAHMFGTIHSSLEQQQQQLAELTNTTLIACLDINECLATSTGKPVCGTGAQCVNTQGGYFCQCSPGYSGNPKVSCVDVDECASQACGPNTQCKNLPGSYKCECKPGYSGNAYSADGCQDEDECLRKNACGLNAQCFNTLGSFQCSCLSGFTGDAYAKCADIDECSTGNPCGQGAQCQNVEGGYKCSCPEKYLARGTPEMGCERAAVDIGCGGDFDCTQNALCVNSTCQCKLGYQINGIDCIDVDECAVSLQQSLNSVPAAPVKAFTRLNMAAIKQNSTTTTTTSLCGLEAVCQNTDGSYKCECKSGYEKVEPQVPTSKCRDVNECERTPNPCGQNSKCFNTDGSFKCLCNDGFIAIDPSDSTGGCKSPCDGVSCGQHATCKPHGEEAACVCKPGFTFDPNNIKLGCVDINECDTNYGASGLCGQKAVCTNVPGSYRCHCPSGFAGDAYRYCEDINECDRKFGVFGQCGELAVCTNKLGSFSCACATGFTGDPRTKCTDVDECSNKFGPNGKCGINAICTNTPGRYTCRCPEGYTGDPNEKCTPEQPPCSSSTDCNSNLVCQSGRCQCPFQQTADGQCRHPCDKTECGAHATCQLDSDNQPLCVCDAGYMAPSDGRSGCVDINECIQGISLSGMTPISALTSGIGGVPLGPAGSGSAANSSTGGHPCGRNAICHNQPGSFDCVCPPGYSGNAYESCNMDVRNQQSIASTTTTTANASGQQQQQNTFGNYQQEARTTACSEPCQRGQVCSDGQCVKADSCRDNQDCRTTHSCEHVNQVVGFQCVNVCELNHCGPEAKCMPLHHKPICACNATAGYAGDPYDLVNGCKLQPANGAIRTTTQLAQNTGSTASVFDQFSSLSTGAKQQDQFDLHRTTLSSQQQTSGGGGGGDMSTISFDYGSTPPANQQQTLVPNVLSTTNYSTSTQGQLQAQQAFEQQTKRPNQPLIAYELPLPTTPLLPQFDTFGQKEKTSTDHSSAQNQQQSQTTSVGDQFSSGFGGVTRNPPMSSTTTSTTGSFSSKRTQQQLQQQQQQQFDHQSNNDRQNSNADLTQYQQRQQQDTTGQMSTKTTSSQFDSASSFDQFSNKSAITTGTSTVGKTGQLNAYKQLDCTSDQHCPGNLFCLSYEPTSGFDSHTTKSTLQKFCGCPAGYKREADYCFMQRVNCTSSSVCRAREECIPANILRQSFNSLQQMTTISQQFALSADDPTLAVITTGICICPRGYKLTASGLACIDRNECDEGTPCAVGAICQNKIGSYECVCPPGTAGDPYTKTCEPLIKDECQTSANCANDRECDQLTRKCISPCHVCGPRAICTATNHAAICLCPPRFTGNAIDQVFGCQEPAPATTAATISTSTTTSISTITSSTTTQRPANTTAVGVPVTTLLPSATTTVAPTENTTPELVEFRTIPPSELFVMCLADGIQVEVQLGGFDGIIYVKGHSQDPKCRKLVSSSNANEFVDFKVQFGNCDLIHRDGEAGFVLVIQKHPKLVTYRARAYHVKCVYNTGERTVTLGFNVSMITTSGTIANTGPPPTCLMSITSLEGREVTSAEIGQDLLLRVDVQPDSIYGGFARSCEAKTMDDEGEYQYEVTDSNGCATDPSIFSDWKYDQHRKSLVARFNAFKFPSSNNLRFQCNIRVCFGSCPAVNCNGVDAYGKRRRRREAPVIGGSNITSETDFDNIDTPTDELIVTDTFKEGALREEIMVQSNAILTFDRKEASLPQQQQKQVEDIEFVCLPRLGIVMSIGLTTLLILLALAVASSCWCFAKKRRPQNAASTGRGRKTGPLPHPVDFPNPLMRATSTSTLRESLYGP